MTQTATAVNSLLLLWGYVYTYMIITAITSSFVQVVGN